MGWIGSIFKNWQVQPKQGTKKESKEEREREREREREHIVPWNPPFVCGNVLCNGSTALSIWSNELNALRACVGLGTEHKSKVEQQIVRIMTRVQSPHLGNRNFVSKNVFSLNTHMLSSKRYRKTLYEGEADNDSVLLEKYDRACTY